MSSGQILLTHFEQLKNEAYPASSLCELKFVCTFFIIDVDDPLQGSLRLGEHSYNLCNLGPYL